MRRKLDTGGFLVLEILIAGLILTSGVAATMYLFRVGYAHLERAKISNTLSVKLVQTASLLRTLDLGKKGGVEDMGDGVALNWRAGLLSAAKPALDPKNLAPVPFDLLLYQVRFTLSLKGTDRDYAMRVFQYREARP